MHKKFLKTFGLLRNSPPPLLEDTCIKAVFLTRVFLKPRITDVRCTNLHTLNTLNTLTFQVSLMFISLFQRPASMVGMAGVDNRERILNSFVLLGVLLYHCEILCSYIQQHHQHHIFRPLF